MALDAQQVSSIAELAKLTLSAEQLPEYQQNLGNILSMFEQLAAVDTEHIEPLTNPHDATQRLRADIASEPSPRDYYQTRAPHTEDGYYLVPRVVE